MKTIFHVFFLFLLESSVVLNAQSNFHSIHYLDPHNPEYVKGEVLVKFKDEVNVESSIKSGIARTGISSVDKILEPYQAEAVEKVFKETREQQNRKTTKTIRDFKGNEIEVHALFNIYKLSFDTIWDIEQIVEELSKDRNVEFVEPNYMVYTMEVLEKGEIIDVQPKLLPVPIPENPPNRNTIPNDPLYGQQWYLNAINAPAAWDSVTGDTTQIIAIIDTGVDWDHPDLDDNIWTNWNEIPDNGIDDDNNGYIDDTRGWDYINNDNDPNDDNSHGTHVAGIAAAEGNNEIGICGVDWNARIMPVKMLQSSGAGSSSNLALGIMYAFENGATVINMSLGSYAESLTVKSALENAYSTAVLVASAGNDDRCLCPECIGCGNMYPACYPFVIGVQASNESGGYTSFTNVDLSGPIISEHSEGFNYEIFAPGQNILSTIPFGSYRSYNGTSMSSAVISGSVALILDYLPDVPNEEIFARLIQGSNNGKINIYGSLTCTLVPELHFINYTLLDTIAGCDNDEVPDAGETIQIFPTVKNTGGEVYNVTCVFRLSNSLDSSKINVIDSISVIGNISTYATLSGDSDPIFLEIDSAVAHNCKIPFEIKIYGDNTTPFFYSDSLVIQNAEELSGVLDSTYILKADKLWLVAQSFRITNNGVLNINPGAELILEQPFVNDGFISGLGKNDSIIEIYGPGAIIGNGNLIFNYTNFDGQTSQLSCFKFTTGEFNHCIFENFKNANYGLLEGNVDIKDCIIRDCRIAWIRVSGSIYRSNIYNIDIYYHPYELFTSSNVIFKYNNFSDITGILFSAIPSPYTNLIENNLIYRNDIHPYIGNSYLYKATSDLYFEYLPTMYWGTTKDEKINTYIYDFWKDPSLAMVYFNPKMNQPSDSSHGIVWKVEINGIDPQDEQLDPIGSGIAKFDVYFNRPMDTAYTPLLTFGAWEPYTQCIVEDSASWNSDSTIWTAHYDIVLETGDGINVLTVSGANDTEGFEIPPEKNGRFQFIIQAASSASINFIATAGIEKVSVEWPPADTPDVLGYNLYRFYHLTDSTNSDTLRINTELIIDTIYTDYNIVPGTTYYYTFKILGTDMQESDYSKIASATPFSTANGDANCDLSVNVLDITTIVSYMLNQNPTPFLFTAADVNNDNKINILDIIGLVQLISGTKSCPLSALVALSDRPAYYEIKNDKLEIANEGNVAGLQFVIEDKKQKDKDKIRTTSHQPPITNMQALRIFSLQKGFEFAYAVLDDHILGILYSFTAKELPAGDIELFRIEGMDSNNLEITEIFGGNLDGDYVPILKKGTQLNVLATDDNILSVQPNPFTGSTIIGWQLTDDAIMDITIYNFKGHKLKQITNGYYQSGSHQINWNGKDEKNNELPAGIYICHIEVIMNNGNIAKTQDVKIVLVK